MAGGLQVSLDLQKPKIKRAVDQSLEGLDQQMGEEMVRTMSGSPQWPTDTGASGRGWGVVKTGKNHVRLTNTQKYAPFVEARGGKRKRKAQAGKTARKRPGPARTTLKKSVKPLTATLEAVVTRRLRKRLLGG